MDEPGGPYGKSEVSTGRQRLHDLTYMWNLKKIKLMKTKSKMVVARVGRMGKQRYRSKKKKFPICTVNPFRRSNV
jgi:hypothetical protein